MLMYIKSKGDKMVITSNDSKGLRELYKVMQRAGSDVELISPPSEDSSFAGLVELKLPNMKVDGKWDLNITKIITTWIKEFYKNKDRERAQELKLMKMKLVLYRENGDKDIIDIETIEQNEIEPPKDGDKLSIEETEINK